MQGGGSSSTSPSVTQNIFAPNKTVTIDGQTFEASYSVTGTSASVADASEGTGQAELSFDSSGHVKSLKITGTKSNANFSSNSSTNSNLFAGTTSISNGFLIEPTAAGHSYQAFGVWDSQDSGSNGASGNVGAISGGYGTPASSVPTSGSASFTGAAIGTYVDNSGNSYITGAISTMTTDFSSRTGTFSLSDTKTIARNGGTQGTATKLNVASQAISWSSNSNTFSSGSITNSSGMTGSVSGKFYGPSAEEVGGVFKFSGTGSSPERYIGAFGAKKQ